MGLSFRAIVVDRRGLYPRRLPRPSSPPGQQRQEVLSPHRAVTVEIRRTSCARRRTRSPCCQKDEKILNSDRGVAVEIADGDRLVTAGQRARHAWHQHVGKVFSEQRLVFLCVALPPCPCLPTVNSIIFHIWISHIGLWDVGIFYRKISCSKM